MMTYYGGESSSPFHYNDMSSFTKRYWGLQESVFKTIMIWVFCSRWIKTIPTLVFVVKRILCLLACKPCFLHTFSSDTRLIFIVKVTLKIWNKSSHWKYVYVISFSGTNFPGFRILFNNRGTLLLHRGTISPKSDFKLTLT